MVTFLVCNNQGRDVFSLNHNTESDAKSAKGDAPSHFARLGTVNIFPDQGMVITTQMVIYMAHNGKGQRKGSMLQQY